MANPMQPNQKRGVLVVGAGPVGLAAALELARLEVPVRVIDARLDPSSRSKAIGINVRTLELLEDSGVTERLLAKGRRINKAELRNERRLIGRIDFSRLDHRYNFMLGLPQYETAAIIEARLNELGIQVERGVRFQSIQHHGQTVVSRLYCEQGAVEVEADYVLGADGAHSTIRDALGIEFSGSNMNGDWSLADVRMECPWDPDAVNLQFGRNDFLFVLRFAEGLFRIASNRSGVLGRLPPGFDVHDIVWQSRFSVSHRQAATNNIGRIFLAGDAAHVHSPLGARGMNLGIEDAVAFARRIAHGRIYQYSAERHRAGAEVIRMVKAQTRLATGNAPGLGLLRNGLLPLALNIGAAHTWLVRKMVGLG